MYFLKKKWRQNKNKILKIKNNQIAMSPLPES